MLNVFIGRNGFCEFDNLTIKEFDQDTYAFMHSSKTYCGNEIPNTMLLSGNIQIIFQTDRWMQRPGFILHYEIDGISTCTILTKYRLYLLNKIYIISFPITYFRMRSSYQQQSKNKLLACEKY